MLAFLIRSSQQQDVVPLLCKDGFISSPYTGSFIMTGVTYFSLICLVFSNSYFEVPQ